MSAATTGPTPTVPAQPGPSGVRRRVVLAWGLWDWGAAAYNAVIA